MVAHNDNHSIERELDGMKVNSSLTCSALASLHTHQMNIDYGQNNDCHVVEILGLP